MASLDSSYEQTTYIAWTLSMNKILLNVDCDEYAIIILFKMAYLQPNNIYISLFTSVNHDSSEKAKLFNALQILVNYSMIEFSDAHQCLNIHGLIQRAICLLLIENQWDAPVVNDLAKQIKNHGELIFFHYNHLFVQHALAIWNHMLALNNVELIYENIGFPIYVCQLLYEFGECNRVLS